MVLGIYDKVNKSVPVRASIFNVTNGSALITPVPSVIAIDNGVTQATIQAANCQGVKIVAKRFTSELQPKVSLTFARTPQVFALRFNRDLVSGTTPSTTPIVQSDYQVPTSGLKPVATSGNVGFGMAADTTQITASYLDDNNVAQPLVQGTFATFSSSGTPNGWAIGANFALKFGDNLKGRFISFQIPNSESVFQTFSGVNFVNLNLYLVLLGIDGTVQQLTYTNVSVDTTGNTNLTEPNQEIGFFTSGEPNYEVINKLNFC